MTLSVSLSFFLSVSLNVGTWERMTLSRASARLRKDDSLSLSLSLFLSKRGSRGEDDSLSLSLSLSRARSLYKDGTLGKDHELLVQTTCPQS